VDRTVLWGEPQGRFGLTVAVACFEASPMFAAGAAVSSSDRGDVYRAGR
jgi:hypothetical protein